MEGARGLFIEWSITLWLTHLMLSLCHLQGEHQVLLKLYNENHSMVACANATIICS